MALEELVVGGFFVILLITAAAVYIALWPWFILAALRRMATAQADVASALTNGPGKKDIAQSMDDMQFNMARLAHAQGDTAKALGRLADAMAAMNQPGGTERR